MTGNKIANKITEISRTSTQNSSDTVTNETENIGHDNKIPKESYIYIYIKIYKDIYIYIYIYKKQKSIDNIRLT